jgi:hypothetical protein
MHEQSLSHPDPWPKHPEHALSQPVHRCRAHFSTPCAPATVSLPSFARESVPTTLQGPCPAGS